MDGGAQHGLYHALGLSFAAELNPDDVKKAYRKMSLKFHPVCACACCVLLPPLLTACRTPRPGPQPRRECRAQQADVPGGERGLQHALGARAACGAELTRTPRGLRWVRRRYAYQPPALGTYRTHRAACPRAPRTVRTGYAYQPQALGTYSVLWQPRFDLDDLVEQPAPSGADEAAAAGFPPSAGGAGTPPPGRAYETPVAPSPAPQAADSGRAARPVCTTRPPPFAVCASEVV